jgi:ribonuclease P protein component
VQRRFRLTRATDFQRVRRSGKSYAHPLVVLVVGRSEHPLPRVGLVVGRSLGNAVQRNRAKRRLRAAMLPFLPVLAPGHDFILIGRAGLLTASFPEIQQALQTLLRRAHLLPPEENDLAAD